jgi:hypothetical protein
VTFPKKEILMAYISNFEVLFPKKEISDGLHKQLLDPLFSKKKI